jgi:Domain of unknown function (DUF4129)
VNARRLLPLGLAVTVLLAAAGLASHGRPLSRSRGGGPSATFFDYVFTTVVLATIAIAVASVIAMRSWKPSTPAPQPRKWHVVTTLMTLASALLLSWFLYHAHLADHLRNLNQQQPKTGTNPGASIVPRLHGRARGARLRWDEIAVVAVLLGAVGVAAWAATAGKRPRPPWTSRSQEALSAALDESLDDLRSEPDLRRAIIAAYARMERALAVAGTPRKPAEAPLEYLARALRALDASAPAVTRLTDLFEWAKFSQHAPEPAMRDEAIDALVAVRDELRRPAAVPA